MGFVPGITTQIEAFLTEKGAQQLMESGINNIKYFAVSDNASNYVTSTPLNLNEVFSLSGKYLVNGKQLSILNETTMDSRILVDNSGETFKSFEGDSGTIMLDQIEGTLNTVTAISIYPYDVDRTDTTSQYLNWISDLKLPYGSGDNSLWTATFSSNGYSNTSISDMNTDNFLIFVIDGIKHSYIDGKTIKFTIPYLSGSVDTYGTYINTNYTKSSYDGLSNETSQYLRRFGSNVVLLFCDDIQKPNADATKSWSTGYDYGNGAFSQGNKSLANFIASSGVNKDVAVGMAFLDKGVIVIFNNVLYNGYINRLTNNLQLQNKNIVRRTVANYVCDLPIGKFVKSLNTTYSTGNSVRISSIGLYNSNKELVALGRFSAEVEKNVGQRLTFLVKLVI